MSTFSDIQAAAKLLLEAQKLPEYEKLLKAMEQLTDLQDQLNQAKAELNSKTAELARIHDDIGKIEKMNRFSNEFLKDGNGFTYCVGCAFGDKRLAPVVWANDGKHNSSSFSQCTRCKQTFHKMVR